MKLIMSPASPFARKVRVAIHELDLADRIEEMPVQTTALASDPAAVAANPSGRIPALVRPEGPAIHDSRVVCRFVDALAGGGLYPEPRLWEVLTLEATGHALSEAALAMVYEARFKGTVGASAAWIEEIGRAHV